MTVARRKYLPRFRKNKFTTEQKINKTEAGFKKPSVHESLDPCLQYLAPREQFTTLAWCKEHARNTDGRPYSHNLFPHLGAPGGPADAIDDPHVRKVWLQFASRLGKTYFGQCCAIKKADCNPGPMMLASSVEKTATEVTERTYAIIENSPRVAWQLRPKHRRKQKCIDFDACQCVVAWSRSVSTLADKEVEFGHANEIDKWEHISTSKEADPLKLFMDRFKNRPHHKVLLESTPSVKNHSRVESGRLESTNCQFYVPCPHCGRYQTLIMGSKDEPRLCWEHLPNGRSTKELARKTAHYRCINCEKKIEDHHRAQMMRNGVWCPEGCTVNDHKASQAAERRYLSVMPPEALDSPPENLTWQGWSEADWIVGTPLRDGTDAGYKLSSLYALSLSWGDIAAEFVACQGRPQELRNFINQWLAETWEHTRKRTTWEELGEKLIDHNLQKEFVPEWATLLTAAIDRQGEDGERFPWSIIAWGVDPDTSVERCHTLAYGQCDSFNEVRELLLRQWPRVLGGPGVKITFALFDSGYRPDGVYEFCRACHQIKIPVWPCKGSQYALDSDFRQSILGPNTSMPDMVLFLVDTIRSQLWMDSLLSPDNHNFSLFGGSLFDHQDYLEQLVNDAVVEDLDSHNNIRQSWERVDTRVPNDYRDTLRYSYVAKIIATGGRPLEARNKTVESQPAKRRNAVVNQGISREDGRSWLE